MSDLLVLGLGFGAWLFLQIWLLPRLGVST